MDLLARHLGHDIRIHHDFYRLHDAALELSKISKLLVATEEGNIHIYSGKSLNDINVSNYIENNEIINNENEDVDGALQENKNEKKYGI